MSGFWQQYLEAVPVCVGANAVVSVMYWAWHRAGLLPFRWGPGFWAAGAAFGGGLDAAFRDWGAVAACATVSAVALAVWWYRRRRDRKRKALAALGHKARARLAAMARAMREAGKPRPVLRPVPGGVR